MDLIKLLDVSSPKNIKNVINTLIAEYENVAENFPTKLSDLTDDATHRLVTDTEKASWNAKLETKDIPTKISAFENDSKYATEDYVQTNGGKIDAIKFNGNIQTITDKVVSLTESDPTVPAWAKTPNKPEYAYTEIKNTPVIPSIEGLATEEYVDKAVEDKALKSDISTLSTKVDNNLITANKYTDTSIANLVGQAPEAMNTIYELATVLETNQSALDTLTTAIGTKVNKTTKINNKPLEQDITLTKYDIGLSNVDNTSDADKPVSTATQSALNLKADQSALNTTNTNLTNLTTRVTQNETDIESINTRIGQVNDKSNANAENIESLQTKNSQQDESLNSLSGRISNIENLNVENKADKDAQNLGDVDIVNWKVKLGFETDITNLSNAIKEKADKDSFNLTNAEIGYWQATLEVPSKTQVTNNTTAISNLDTKIAQNNAYYDAEIETMKSNISSNSTGIADALEGLADVYTKSEIDNKGYLTSIPSEYVTETELTAKGYETITNVDSKNLSTLTDANNYTDGQISSLKDELLGEGASEALDTIGELAVALKENEDVVKTLNDAVGSKANQSDLEKTNTNLANLTTRVANAETKNAEQDTAIQNARIGLQTEITETNKLSSDLVDDTLNKNKFVTDTEKQTWNSKASTDYVDQKVGYIVNGAPDDYDTLQKIAIKVQLNEESLASLKENNATQDYVDFELGVLENKLTPLINAKVEKITGKGLSTNDYTTDEKNKLSSIEAGAQKNVQSDWIETNTSSSSYIKNKPTIPVPKNGILTIQKNGTHVAYFSANQEEDVIANIGVPTTPSEIGAEPSFTKNTAFNKNFETSSSNIKMNGTASVGSSNNVARSDHTHPTDTSRASATDLSNLSNVVDGKVSKETGKGLSTNDYTTAEKNKLAGIESGAQVNPTNYVTTDTAQSIIGEKTFDEHTNFKRLVRVFDTSSDYSQNRFEVGVWGGKVSFDYLNNNAVDAPDHWYGTAFEIIESSGVTDFKKMPTVNGVELATKTDVEESGGIIVDTELSSTSPNPVQNNIITNRLTEMTQAHNLLSTDLTNVDNAKLNKTGGNVTGNLFFIKDPYNVGSHDQKIQPNLKWVTVNENTPYIGFATDQTDGTFVISSLKGTNYASGLAIGGGSGDLLWKGNKVAVASDIPTDYAKKSEAVYFVDGTGNTTAGTWEGTNNRITSYYDGLVVNFKVGIRGGASITTLNINGLGAKNCYMRENKSITSICYPIGTMVLLSYNATTDAFYSTDYDANNNVYQAVSETNGDFPLLLRGTGAGTTSTTSSTSFGTKFLANPSTGELKATSFTENGTALSSKYIAKSSIDSALSSTSTNPVQNKIVTNKLATKVNFTETSETTETVNRLLDLIYPVGSIYLTINGADYSSFLGGTWVKVSEGRTLFGAGTLNGITYTAGSTVDAGLPNITGAGLRGGQDGWSEGAFREVAGGQSNGAGGSYGANYSFDASMGETKIDGTIQNDVYGKSNTVQPNAYVVYMWRRTA